MHFSPLGDRTITITLGTSIDEPTHRLVRAVSAMIDTERPPGFVDQVPAFASVTVHYDPARVDAGDEPNASPYQRMVKLLDRQLSAVRVDTLPPPRCVEIPVCYGGDLGPDLGDVATRHQIT